MKQVLTIVLLAIGAEPAARGDVPPTGAKPPAPPRSAIGWFASDLPPAALRRLGSTNLRGCTETFAFAPDGKSIAVITGNYQQATIFEVKTGKPIRTFDGRWDQRISFSADGKRLLIAGANAKATLWDVATGQRLHDVPGHLVVFVDQGKRIVAQVDGGLQVVDPDTNRVLETVKLAKDRAVERLSTADLKIAVSRHDPGPIDALALPRRVEVCTLPGMKVLASFDMGGTRREMCFSGDGKRFAYTVKDGIHVWDFAAGKEVRYIKHRCDSGLALSHDGTQVAWSGYDEVEGIAFVWACDVKDGRPRHVGAPTNMLRNTPAFSPDGGQLAFLDEGHALVIRDVRTGRSVLPVDGHTGYVGHVHFTPDGKHVVSRDKNSILVWERASGCLVRRFPNDLPDGERPVIGTLGPDSVVTVAEDGTLRLRDLVSGKEIITLAGKHGFVFGAAAPAALAPEAKVVVLQSKDYNIRAYDLNTGKLLLDFEPPCAVWDVMLSPSGRYISWTSQNHPKGDGNRFLDVKTGKEVAKAIALPSFPLADEMGRWGLRGSGLTERLNELRVDGKLLIGGWPEIPQNMYRSRDGRHLAARRVQHNRFDTARPVEIVVWEVAMRRRLPAFDPMPTPAETGSFSPDGRLFVTTDDGQGAIQVWELATGQARAEFHGHRATVGGVVFSADGRVLASGGAEGQVYLWDLTGRRAQAQRTTHGPERLGELYRRLIDSAAAKARLAIHELAGDPEGAVKFLAEHIKPIEAPDSKEVARLIAALDAPEFSVRQKASANLAKRGELVLLPMRAAEKKLASEEQAERLRKLIAEVERPDARGEALRAIRAVEVVERIGTAEARKLLRSWASGAADATLTREAKWALERLK